jgi:hypothetical protein
VKGRKIAKSKIKTADRLGGRTVAIRAAVMRRLDLAGQELPSSIEAFVATLDRIGN